MLIGSQIFIHDNNKSTASSLDLPGTILSIIGMVALVYGLVGEVGRRLSFIIAVIFIAGFIFREALAKHPMMPLRLFADRERLGAYLSRFFYLASIMTFWYFTPQGMQRILGFSPLTSAFMFIPLTVFNFFIALRVAPLTRRLGNTRLLFLGVGVSFIGMLSMQLFRIWPNYLLGLAIPMIIIGIGQGLSLSPLTVAGVANTDQSDSGAASGVVNMIHQLGGAVGLALTVSVIGNLTPFSLQFNDANLIIALLMLLSFIAALIIPRKKINY